MPKIGPIFGALTVFIFYFVAKHLTENKKIALLSTLFFSVLPFHVYQTSHTYPLTIGHFFLMLSILFFIKYRKDIRYVLPLFFSTFILIMTHHLTTYFYLIILVFIVFIENISNKNWTKTIKKDIPYILATSVLTFSYWAFIAIPVYEGFMNYKVHIGAFTLANNVIVFLFYTLLFSSLVVIILIRKIIVFSRKKHKTNNKILDNRKIVSKFLSFIASFYLIKLFISIMIFFIIMLFLSIVNLPVLNIKLPLETVFLTIPYLIILSLAIIGLIHTYKLKNGPFILGWLFAVLFSLLLGILTNTRQLFPQRHPEYFEAALSIMAAYGIYLIYKNNEIFFLTKKIKEIFKIREKNIKKSEKKIVYRNTVIALIVVLIVFSSALSIYPLHRSLGQSNESISPENILIIEEWMNDNLDKNSTLVVSDHRLERLVESSGFNTTQDEAYYLWISENVSGCIDELLGLGKNYSRITHVLIDDVMYNDLVHLGIQKEGVVNAFMTEKSYKKFEYQPFELLHSEENIDKDTGERLRWSEIYKINWSYISDYFYKIT